MTTKTWQELTNVNRLIALKQTSKTSNYILKKKKTHNNSVLASGTFWTGIALFDLVILADILLFQAKLTTMLIIILSGG